MSETTITKTYLLEGFRYLLDMAREHLDDAAIVGQERNKWVKVYTDALSKSVTLVKETDLDELTLKFDELVEKYEILQGAKQ